MTPKRIAALRRRLGENVSTFGARFFRSGRTVEDWESGRRRPDKLVRLTMNGLENAVALAKGNRCGVIGFPDGVRKVCQLARGHGDYHRQGHVRWLGNYGRTIAELDRQRRRR